MDEVIAANLATVHERVAAACGRAGRSASDVTLVAVSKTVAAERIRAAWTLGLTDFGENRVQEARQKMPLLADIGARWHMIGHLQSNKAGQAAEMFAMVQSLDSLETAGILSHRLARAGRSMPVLLEVNTGGEETKSGFRPEGGSFESFFVAAQEIASLPGLDVQGLMTVAPIVEEPDLARPVFRRLRLLRDELRVRFPQRAWQHLSMGMTDDFEVAIEEGATIVRLGRAIFGARPALGDEGWR
jgi:PLP dependent protein